MKAFEGKRGWQLSEDVLFLYEAFLPHLNFIIVVTEVGKCSAISIYGELNEEGIKACTRTLPLLLPPTNTYP